MPQICYELLTANLEQTYSIFTAKTLRFFMHVLKRINICYKFGVINQILVCFKFAVKLFYKVCYKFAIKLFAVKLLCKTIPELHFCNFIANLQHIYSK
jgi:hypothetical protein